MELHVEEMRILSQKLSEAQKEGMRWALVDPDSPLLEGNVVFYKTKNEVETAFRENPHMDALYIPTLVKNIDAAIIMSAALGSDKMNFDLSDLVEHQEKTILEESVTRLSQQLLDIGLTRPPVALLAAYIESGQPVVMLPAINFVEGKTVELLLGMTYDRDEELQLRMFRASIVKDPLGIPLPEKFVSGIDIEELDKRMLAVDWNNEDTLARFLIAEESHVDADLGKDLLEIFHDLTDLLESSRGARTVGALTTRHWMDTPFDRMIGGDTRDLAKYSQQYNFPIGEHQYTINDAVRLLLGQSIYKQKDIEGQDSTFSHKLTTKAIEDGRAILGMEIKPFDFQKRAEQAANKMKHEDHSESKGREQGGQRPKR